MYDDVTFYFVWFLYVQIIIIIISFFQAEKPNQGRKLRVSFFLFLHGWHMHS